MNEPTRTETDSFGSLEVPADRLYGAQTQRSLKNFAIGAEKMPPALIRGLGIVKLCAAKVNLANGALDEERGEAIIKAASEVASGRWDEHFPLSVWQTGSGTQSNMNANEVIANRAIELLGGKIGSKSPIHPNDHVNCGQSSNDVFPTAMHIAAAEQIHSCLFPAVDNCICTLEKKEKAFAGIVKIGRTHLQDATPLTLAQEFSGFRVALMQSAETAHQLFPRILALAQGGTAVGTGLNSKQGFDKQFATQVASFTGLPFCPAANKFEALSTHDALVACHSTLKNLAVTLYKIANDLRLLGSGPRCGLGELRLPANEPGSSIMPGKVNPTQCEAMTMLCLQVIGNDTTLSMAGSQGHLQLNVYKPLIAHGFLQSARLLSQGIISFTRHCLEGIEPDAQRIREHLENSLMLVTALSPHIGYDCAAAIAKRAYEKGTTLRSEALESGALTQSDFDAWVDPQRMTGPEPEESGQS